MTHKNLAFSSPLNCLCFNARKAARIVTRIYDEALAPAGITATQFSLLAVLAGAEEVRVSDLAKFVETDRTTLTRNLALLERAGWIVRKQGEDGRERMIRLTVQGRQKLKFAMRLWADIQEKTVRAVGVEAAARLIEHVSVLAKARIAVS